jgi:hypothetical protein
MVMRARTAKISHKPGFLVASRVNLFANDSTTVWLLPKFQKLSVP